MTVIDELAAAFEQTAHAHHEAYADVDGADPDWALWYADRIKPRFDELLSAPLSKIEIVALLFSLAAEHEARGGDAPWPRFYAELTAERFVDVQGETLALYEFESCPYCRRVRRVIDELKVDVALRDVLREPKWRDELLSVRGRATVPVLRCESPDGTARWLPESRDIIAYLRRRYG